MDKADLCKNMLNQYMKDFLDKKISMVEYYDLSERCYTLYADFLKIQYPKYDEVFMSIIPDACTFYIDEPGSDNKNKEISFEKEVSKAYKKLRDCSE